MSPSFYFSYLVPSHPLQRFTGFPFSPVNKIVYMGKQDACQGGASQKIPDQLVDAAVRS